MKTNQIPDIMLERYVLEELDIKKMDEIRKLCENDPDVSFRVMKIKESNIEILDAYPEEKIAAEITHKADAQNAALKKTRRIPKIYLRVFAPIAIAAAAIVVVLLPAVKQDVAVIVPDDITREKGKEMSLYLYRKNRNGEIDIMKNGSKAKPGDLLQIGYSSLKNGYGVILSIDGRGKVTLHYPADEKASTRLDAGKKRLLDNSFELDDAPDFERFFFITSSNEINTESVIFFAELLAVERKKAELEKLTFGDSRDESLNQVSFLIKKD
ncbi:MAG: hypothetical protein JXN64_00220 [Spirochaetes bacterium]|nr:hypothetical protein [Spirochaetota bacterium]